MSKRFQKLSNRVLAMILAVVMIVSVLPVSALAVAASVVSTDLGDKNVIVGEYTEFTVTTTANDDLGKMVFGYFEFNDGDWSVVESLQYKESRDGNWYDLIRGTPFGPVGTGFPMADATSTFRVKFKTAGSYPFSVSMKTADEAKVELCALNQIVVANPKPSEVTTNIVEVAFVAGTPSEFTFTAIPNDDVNEYVLAKVVFSDWDAVKTLEYWNETESKWVSLEKDSLIGPADTGFLMTGTPTRMQVTFNRSGSYTCKVAMVKASDPTFELCNVEKTITVTDTTPPVVSETLGNPENWAQSAVIKVQVTDEGGSNVAKVIYGTNDVVEEAVNEAVLVNGEYTFELIANGTYYIWAVDGDGNVSAAKSIVVDKIDRQNPDLEVTTDPDAWTNGAVTIDISASDTSGVTVKYNTSEDMESATELTLKDGKAELVVSDEYNGSYYIWAEDAAGNVASAIAKVQIDKTKPSVVIAEISTDWTNEDVVVNGTVADAASGVIKVVYGTSEDLKDAVAAELNGMEYHFTVTQNGTYWIWSQDLVGIYSDPQKIEFQNIDKIKPTVDSVTAPLNWVKGDAVITVVASDDLSGVAKVIYGTDKEYSADKEYKEASLKEDGSYSFTISAQDYEDSYYVWAIDQAGNVSEMKSVALKMDKTLPAVISVVADPMEATNKSVTVSGTVSDNLSGIAKVVYGTDEEYSSELAEASLKEDGSYSFVVSKDAQRYGVEYYVWAVDNAGNVSEKANVTVYIDIIAPKVGSATANHVTATNENVTITVNVSDADSGVARVVYGKSEKFGEQNHEAKLNENGEYTFVVDEEYRGNYYVWAIDNAGNHSEPAVVAVHIDKTPAKACITAKSRIWEEFLAGITFGLYAADDLSVEITATDIGSNVKNIFYIIADGEKTVEELDAMQDWIAYTDPFEITEEQKFVVYARIVDNAGNLVYYNTDGIVLDKTVASITLTTSDPVADNGVEGVYGYYNGDVTIDVSVDDSSKYSGIKSIEYWVTKDGEETQRETLYSFGYDEKINYKETDKTWKIVGSDVDEENGTYTGAPTYEMLKKNWAGEFTVYAERNNSSNVVVTVQVTDNAGNVTTQEIKLDIDISEPVVNLAYDNGESEMFNEKYFNGMRTATITVMERSDHFLVPTVYINENVPEGENNYIHITAVDAAGEPVAFEPVIEWDTTYDRLEPDKALHVATIEYDVDANYVFDIKVTDATTNTGIAAEGSESVPSAFTVDATDPVGSVSINNHDAWNALLEALTFGIYTTNSFEVNAAASDATSPIKVEYCVVSGDDAVPNGMAIDDIESWTEVELDQLVKQEPLMTLEEAERYVIYLRITDMADNVTHVSTDGLIMDDTGAAITLEPSDPVADNGVEGVYGYYNDDVTIDVSVDDSSSYSGIKSIEYWVTNDGVETQRETLYSFGYDGSYNAELEWEICDSSAEEKIVRCKGIPTYEMLMKSWESEITVDAELNNSSNVVVTVQVADNAGNVTTQEIKLDIDEKKASAPVVNLTYDNGESEMFNEKYFNGTRTATITVMERPEHFVVPTVYINKNVPEGENNYIHITAVNAKGEPVAFDPVIDWNIVNYLSDPHDPDKTLHVATIEYDVDANYVFDIKVTDAAANTNIGVATGSEPVPSAFTVDTMNPTGSLTVDVDYHDVESTWNEILEALTFGFYDRDTVAITIKAEDKTSPVTVEYYKVTGTDAANFEKTEDIDKWKRLDVEKAAVITETTVETVEEYEQFVMYLKVTDDAGHVSYINSATAILDNLQPYNPVITVRGGTPDSGIFNGDVTLDVTVTEQSVDGVYSGLKNVRYEIYNDDVSTDSGVLKDFSEEKTPTKLIHAFATDENNCIVVKAAENNSNKVKVKVIVTDNAGNISEAEIALKIDITAPHIVVKYDNNSVDSGHYYKNDRTATIMVVDRNFDATKVKFNVTNDHGNTGYELPAADAWTAVDAAEWNGMIPAAVLKDLNEDNGDLTVHIAKVRYTKDGDYKFAVETTDLAGWTCGNMAEQQYNNPVTVASGTNNPFEFTIDKTLPIIRVSCDNNAALNGNYFKAGRTLTVTIIEHNFPREDIKRVSFKHGTDRGGVTPNVIWSHNGDTHTATFKYTTDGDYTFDVSMLDLAGNQTKTAEFGSTVAGRDFIIDTTYEDMVTIGGVENGTAYGYGVPVIPTVDISDINLDTHIVTLTGIQKDKKIDLTDEVNKLLSVGSQNVNGIFDVFESKRELDGIYTLSVTGYDKAGNEDPEKVVFTVNRFGSVYVYDSNLLNLTANDGAYVKSVENDLVIEEYNADELLAGGVVVEITRDGKPLEEVKWTANAENNDGNSWYKYVYTLSKENFAADGVYKITISSKDATGNVSENNRYENMSITFRVDSTPSEISSIVGLEDAIINATERLVKFTIYDAVGLKAVRVYVDNVLVNEVLDFKGDVYNYTGELTLKEKNAVQEVRIEVEDLAGNITNTADKSFTSAYEFNSRVTVSTNIFVRWFANKPLFYGSIVAVIGAAVGLGIFVAGKLKKKEEEEAAAAK